MAKQPRFTRLLTDDFKDQSEWIGRLLDPINNYMEQNNAALNKALTLADNMAAALLTIELDGQFPLKLRWDLTARPVSVIVGNVYRSNGANFTLTSAVQVQWSFNQASQLQIDGVVGITPSASAKYKLVIECKTG